MNTSKRKSSKRKTRKTRKTRKSKSFNSYKNDSFIKTKFDNLSDKIECNNCKKYVIAEMGTIHIQIDETWWCTECECKKMLIN
jgi:hypothetical protein